MFSSRLIGLVIFAVGVVLLVLGINATSSVRERLNEAVTGNFTDQTTLYLVGGIAAIVVGGVVCLFGGRGRR